MKTIFIAGLHHSGTTLLDMLIGSHPQCISVGEVTNVIAEKVDRDHVRRRLKDCTCVRDSKLECQFWPEVLRRIDADESPSLSQRYQHFLDTFAEFYPGKILVDSSKWAHHAEALQQVSDCHVVYCVRDVRGWSVSHHGEVSALGMIQWYRRNKRQLGEIPSVVEVVSYERLAMDTESTMDKLYFALSLPAHRAALEDVRESHILIGNKMRNHNFKGVRYDKRWMSKSGLWPALLAPIMRFNNRLVHTSEK